jgi:hypothetical protein
VAERLSHDVLADRDQLASQMQVVDRAAVMLGIDDRHRRFGEPRQILRAADLGKGAVLVEQILQRDRVGDLAAFDEPADRGIDAAVDGVAEMLRHQELGDPRMRRVVDEDRPEQRLLGLDVGGRLRQPVEIGLAQRSDGCLHRGQDSIARRAPLRLFDAQAVERGDAYAPLPHRGRGWRA